MAHFWTIIPKVISIRIRLLRHVIVRVVVVAIQSVNTTKDWQEPFGGRVLIVSNQIEPKGQHSQQIHQIGSTECVDIGLTTRGRNGKPKKATLVVAYQHRLAFAILEQIWTSTVGASFIVTNRRSMVCKRYTEFLKSVIKY
jgi:hypothetical protein